ncbi:MAG: right-handed parallel beta-helix repeat-containing protein [Planctomycetota bacterium]|jgi:hypothetical protein
MIDRPDAPRTAAQSPRTSRRGLTALTALVTALTLATPAAADTYVVDDDGGPGVDFTDIQPAVDVASPGDLIVVRDGTYGTFVLEQGLRLVADTGHAPEIVFTGIEVRNVPAGQTALMAGFGIPHAYVHDCSGTVMFDADAFGPDSGGTTVRIYRCELVVVSRSTIEAWNGSDLSPSGPNIAGQRGVELLDTTVVFSQCDIEGGEGATLYKSDGLKGEPAILARDALLFLQATSVQGGFGGDWWGPDPAEFDCDGGDGAPALSLERCEVELFGRTADLVRGGAGGEPSWLSAVWGVSAPAIEAVDSDIIHAGAVITTYDGVPVFDGTGSTLVEIVPAIPVLTPDGDGLLGGTLEPVLEAPTGSQFLLWLAPDPAVQQIGMKHTQSLLDHAFLLTVASGTIDATGTYALTFGVPVLPALQGQALHWQAYVRPTVGPDVLGTSASCVVR